MKASELAHIFSMLWQERGHAPSEQAVQMAAYLDGLSADHLKLATRIFTGEAHNLFAFSQSPHAQIVLENSTVVKEILQQVFLQQENGHVLFAQGKNAAVAIARHVELKQLLNIQHQYDHNGKIFKAALGCEDLGLLLDNLPKINQICDAIPKDEHNYSRAKGRLIMLEHLIKSKYPTTLFQHPDKVAEICSTPNWGTTREDGQNRGNKLGFLANSRNLPSLFENYDKLRPFFVIDAWYTGPVAFMTAATPRTFAKIVSQAATLQQILETVPDQSNNRERTLNALFETLEALIQHKHAYMEAIRQSGAIAVAHELKDCQANEVAGMLKALGRNTRPRALAG